MAYSGRPTLAALGPDLLPAIATGPEAAAVLRGMREGWDAIAQLAAARVWSDATGHHESALIDAVVKARAADSYPYSRGFKVGAYAALDVLAKLAPAVETTAAQTIPASPEGPTQ